MRVRHPAVLLAALLCLTGTAPIAVATDADPLVELRRLSSEGRTDRALSRLAGLITSHPDDPRLPFEKALLLTSQRRLAEAIAVYERMLTTFPGLPEPLNNLGALYAATGDLDRARTAFENALNAEQASRTAYANLGQVSMRLAGRAYARALRIDDVSSGLTLAAIPNLPETPKLGAPGASSLPTVAAGASTAAALPQVLASVSRQPDASRIASPAASAVPSMAIAPPRATSAAAIGGPPASSPPRPPPTTPPPPDPATPLAGTQASPSDGAQARDVQSAIAAWATAWSQKNVAGYFASYVPGYKGNDASASAWQAGRRVRILGKSRIAVGVSRVAVVVARDGSATASFRQNYVADQLNVSSSKTLEFVRQGGKWLIRRELAGS